MTIIGLLIGICVLLFACWLVQTYLPVPWKTPVLAIIVLIGLVWLLMNLFPGLGTAHLNR